MKTNDIQLKERQFIVSDDKNGNILGGGVSYYNPYICLYNRVLGEKQPDELKKGESTKVIFTMCGSKTKNNECWITRVE